MWVVVSVRLSVWTHPPPAAVHCTSSCKNTEGESVLKYTHTNLLGYTRLALFVEIKLLYNYYKLFFCVHLCHCAIIFLTWRLLVCIADNVSNTCIYIYIYIYSNVECQHHHGLRQSI